MVVYACNPGTQEVEEAGRSEVYGHPQLHRECEGSLGHMRTFLERGREESGSWKDTF